MSDIIHVGDWVRINFPPHREPQCFENGKVLIVRKVVERHYRTANGVPGVEYLCECSDPVTGYGVRKVLDEHLEKVPEGTKDSYTGPAGPQKPSGIIGRRMPEGEELRKLMST